MVYYIGEKDTVCDANVLEHGKILSDDSGMLINGVTFRIRVVAYGIHIYRHFMVNGEVEEFRELV